MEEKVLKTLEYDKLLEKLAAHAASSLGKAKVRSLRPVSDRLLIEKAQQETEEAITLILSWGDPPLFSIRNLRPLLHRAELGGSLSIESLLAVSEGLRQAQALQDYAREAEESGLVSEIHRLFVDEGLRVEIERSIDDQDHISDRASSALFQLRRSIRNKQASIKDRLNKIMAGEAQAGHLRDAIITMRQGRYVLPVKSEKQARVQGIVHDQSATGQTVYIEPLAIVNLNNEIRQLELEEEKEIRRILALLSEEVAEVAEEMAGNQDLLIFLDFTFAKAKYALKTGSHRPVFSEDRTLNLLEARHPLLGPKVVPIDISLGEQFNSLVITGPNTGGKTVTLKTLGLIQAMGQSGLQIPCRDQSKLAVFSSIYADIGDRQSIEMSLSTFSASMSNIVEILQHADRDSLLLFDEIGSGTDPTEGAALAMSILQWARDRDIRTVATTHYSELKLFAIREEGVQNASVKFDVETLSPTYKLEIGLPGRSNAFEISRRLGLPEPILEQAARYLKTENIQFEDVLEDIEAEREKISSERSKIEKERQTYIQKLESMQKELDQAKSAYDRQMEEARQEAFKMIQEARDKSQAMIREAKEASQGRDRRELDRGLSSINDLAKDFENHYEQEPAFRQNAGQAPKELKPGERVTIVSLQQTGILVDGPDKNGDCKVQMGILQVHANSKDLVRAPENEEEKERPSSPAAVIHSRKAMQIHPELDLRGQRYAEAMESLDAYLDDAVLAGLKQVRIIHGKGTGALRKGVSNKLRQDKRVKQFNQAPLNQGGAGATDVELK